MKKCQFCHWLVVGTMTALFGCQPKNNVSPPVSPEMPSQEQVPVPCREAECDEMEADEEASIKVIEIESVQEEESAAKEGQTSIDEQDATTDASPSKEQEIKLEETSEANTQSPPASEEVKLDKPEATEEPVTNTFDNSPNGPISESTVTLP